MPAMTINYTAQEVQRMSHAFGWYMLGLGRDATQEEVRQATMGWQKTTTQGYEQNEKQQAAIQGVTPPDPFAPT
jgi:hypothetical protein